MHACERGHKDIVALLIEKGANVNVVDEVSELSICMLCTIKLCCYLLSYHIHRYLLS